MAYFELLIHFVMVICALYGVYSIKKMFHPPKEWFILNRYGYYILIFMLVSSLVYNFVGVVYITVMGIFVHNMAWIDSVIHGVYMDTSNIITMVTVVFMTILSCGLKRIQDGDIEFNVTGSLVIELSDCVCDENKQNNLNSEDTEKLDDVESDNYQKETDKKE